MSITGKALLVVGVGVLVYLLFVRKASAATTTENSTVKQDTSPASIVQAAASPKKVAAPVVAGGELYYDPGNAEKGNRPAADSPSGAWTDETAGY